MADNAVPFCIVFTKIDRRKKGMGNKDNNMTQFKRELLKVWGLCGSESQFQGRRLSNGKSA